MTAAEISGAIDVDGRRRDVRIDVVLDHLGADSGRDGDRAIGGSEIDAVVNGGSAHRVFSEVSAGMPTTISPICNRVSCQIIVGRTTSRMVSRFTPGAG